MVARGLKEDREKRFQAEAEYQKALIEAALEKALEISPDKLHFDPQGRVVIEVESPDVPGISRSEATLCSLDVMGFVRSGDRFEALKSEYYDRFGTEESNEALNEVLAQRGSLVPLFEELSSHIHLSVRAIEKKLKAQGIEHLKDKINLARDKTDKYLETEVQKAFKGAIRDAGRPVNLASLNAELAKKRKPLKQAAKRIFLTALLEQISEEKTASVREQISMLSKHDLTSITATPYDYFHTDGINGIAERFTSTGDKTAHDKRLETDKKEGEAHTLALVGIRQNQYHVGLDGTIAVKTDLDSSIHARVPSIAVGGYGSDEADSIADVAAKLAILYRDVAEEHGHTGPMTYNLLTSLQSDFWGYRLDASNHQALSAKRIFKGMHQYNKAHAKGERFVFVQNIGVNRHTENLGYTSITNWFPSTITQEATIMADLAMLHNLSVHLERYKILPDDIKRSITEKYGKVLEQYKEYLALGDSRPEYFYASSQGLEARRVIGELKYNLKTDVKQQTFTDDSSLQQRVVQALTKMYTNNEHYNEVNGALVQALSMYTEEASVAGCKSANERHEDVFRRVEYLKGLADRKEKTEEDRTFLKALKSYVTGETNTFGFEQGSTSQIDSTLVGSVNKQAVYSGVCGISRRDQGGPSKLEARNGSGYSLWFKIITLYLGPALYQFFNTNRAAHRSLTNLAWKDASKMQAHKGNHSEWHAEAAKDVVRSEATVVSEAPKACGIGAEGEGLSSDAAILHELGCTGRTTPKSPSYAGGQVDAMRGTRSTAPASLSLREDDAPFDDESSVRRP